MWISYFNDPEITAIHQAWRVCQNRMKTFSSHPYCPFIFSKMEYLPQSLRALSQYFMGLSHLLEQTKYYITLEEHRCPESTQVRLAVYPYCLFYLNSLLFGLLEIWNSVIWSAQLLNRCIRTTVLSITLSCIKLLPGQLT